MELDRYGHFSNQGDRRTVTARNKGQKRKVDTTDVSREGVAGALYIEK